MWFWCSYWSTQTKLITYCCQTYEKIKFLNWILLCHLQIRDNAIMQVNVKREKNKRIIHCGISVCIPHVIYYGYNSGTLSLLCSTRGIPLLGKALVMSICGRSIMNKINTILWIMQYDSVLYFEVNIFQGGNVHLHFKRIALILILSTFRPHTNFSLLEIKSKCYQKVF